MGTGEARLGTAVAPGAESEAVVPQPAAIKSGQESSRTVSKLRAPVPLAERLPTLWPQGRDGPHGRPMQIRWFWNILGLTYHKEQVTNRHRGLRRMGRYMHDRSYGSSRSLRIILECTILHILSC